MSRFTDIEGNMLEVEGPHIVWHGVDDDLGFLINAELLHEVNIGEGQRGASAIQVFINDPNQRQILEYYFEFEDPNTAKILATDMLQAREQILVGQGN